MKKAMMSALLMTGIFLIFSCRKEQVAPIPLAKSNYQFETVKEMPCLPVLDQGTSGTCWAFAMNSLLESEIMRQTGRTIDLSEMYIVRQTYFPKAYTVIMRRGQMPFREGALNPDPLNTSLTYGLVPEQTYTGLLNNQTRHDHQKMFGELEETVKKYAGWEYKGDGWKTEITTILDRNLGNTPKTFSYENQQFTPESFLKYTGLNPNDYVHITSFNHRPFYRKMVLDLPDNFSNESFYNVPLEEYFSTIDHALDNGFTLCIELDVSEPTFSGDYGLAVVPANEADAQAILIDPRPEKVITQAYRQEEIENFHTANDHNVHMVGKMKDQNGKVYYKAKNSWSEKWGKQGYIYLSEAYIKLKVVYVTLHKDGLRVATRKAIGL